MDMIGFIVSAGVVGAGFLVWLTYNRLMALDERCNTAFADIDVQMKHRHSLIPGLIETVRGFAGHELAILKEVTQARAKALTSHAPESRLDAELQVGQTLTVLLSVVGQYPEIQASSHFHTLRLELSDAENRIAAARRFYNLAVDEFNATLRQFPGNRIGEAARLARRKPFDLGVERILLDEPVAVRF